ncbi:DoxX family protein [Rhodohalobacter sp. 8-1]|uniref:DoxX family protein n=1 Tax=Rhodohalobacter sp. 8-1 TaxID=3131972 RepID=UPI0030EC1885
MKKFLRFLMGTLFVLAGINHFINPEWYYPLIPPYLPLPELFNYLSGALEVILGFGLMTATYRKMSAYGIILLMIVFIPAHIHHIQMDGCVSDQICIPAWAAWIRLVIVHPLIMLLAYYIRE